MTTENPTPETNTDSNEKRSTFYEASRKVILAAVGATIIATEELDGFIKRLSERGAIAEKDASRLMREAIERRETLERERKAEAERNTPPPQATKADIDALSTKIAELTAMLEELKARQK